jgi:hypothetical protein
MAVLIYTRYGQAGKTEPGRYGVPYSVHLNTHITLPPFTPLVHSAALQSRPSMRRIADLARPEEEPLLCPRASQVTKIAKIINSEWLVHIRGTPASGKTTLAHLLFSYYRSIGIVLPAWPTTNLNNYQQIILEQAQSEGYTDITKDNLRNSDFVFILAFDETEP